jgi:hypothetical protein
MKRILSTLAILTVTFALSGCKSDEEKYVGAVEDLGSAVEANKDDCDKMGDALQGIFDKNRDLLEEGEKKGKSMSEEETKAFKEEYGPRMDLATEKWVGGALECGNNKKVAAAMQSFFM